MDNWETDVRNVVLTVCFVGGGKCIFWQGLLAAERDMGEEVIHQNLQSDFLNIIH